MRSLSLSCVARFCFNRENGVAATSAKVPSSTTDLCFVIMPVRIGCRSDLPVLLSDLSYFAGLFLTFCERLQIFDQNCAMFAACLPSPVHHTRLIRIAKSGIILPSSLLSHHFLTKRYPPKPLAEYFNPRLIHFASG